MRMTAVLLGSLALAACASDEPPAAGNAADDVAEVAVDTPNPLDPEPAPPATSANMSAPTSTSDFADRSASAAAPALQPMVFDDFDRADLLGTGCTFEADGHGTLFVIKVEGPAGVKIGGSVVRLDGPELDYNNMLRGVSAAGKGLRIAVRPGPAPAKQTGYEVMSRPATMTVGRDGAERRYEGTLNCGS